MFKRILNFFDKIEDRIRRWLSHHPVLYALIGGTGIVLFWRGVWDIADRYDFFTPEMSLVISIIIMLSTGTFVSFFIGEEIIISGLKAKKRFDEKTEEEIRQEDVHLAHVDKEVEAIKRAVDRLVGSRYIE